METLWAEISSNPVGFSLLGGVALICSLFVLQMVINTARRPRPRTKADVIADSLCHSMASGKEWESEHRNWVFLWKSNAIPRFRWIEATRNTNTLFSPVVVKYKARIMDDGSRVEIRGKARKRLIKAMAALHIRLVNKKDEDAVNTVLAAVSDTSVSRCSHCGLEKNKEG